MSDTVRIYVNAKPVDVAASATALQAVESWDATVAAAVKNGERMITDSRGIVMANDSPMHNGAILRIVRVRQTADEENDPSQL
jgi:uncharacterized protein YabE (DUF348 family)